MTWEDFKEFCVWMNGKQGCPWVTPGYDGKDELFVLGMITREHFEQWKAERGKLF